VFLPFSHRLRLFPLIPLMLSGLTAASCLDYVDAPKGASGPDGGASADAATSPVPPPPVNCTALLATAQIQTALANNADGHHNPGMACMDRCHTQNSIGIPFLLAGTVYTTATGTAPLIGATLTIVDGAGIRTTAISAENGNFFVALNNNNKTVKYPVSASIGSCASMQTQITSATMNNCNTAGCHIGTMRIYQPAPAQ
jgi:hypothetical protein